MNTTADKTYKAAIIGCGRVAWLLDKDPLIPNKPCTHAGAYQAVDRTEIVAAADIRADRIHDFSKEYNVDNVYLEYREMLKKESPDIVSICAYAPERFNMVVDALHAGVKGIWCEKAFATSLSEAEEMVRLCQDHGAMLIVSHMRRWSSDYKLARELISDGVIGEPVSVVSHFSGNMIHTGTHAFDVLRFFFGDATLVQGSLEAFDSTKNFNLCGWHFAHPRTRQHHVACPLCGALYVGDGAPTLRGQPVPKRGFRNESHRWKNFISRDTGGYALICFDSGVYATVHADSKGYFIFEFDIMGTEGRIRIGNRLFELYLAEASRTESGLIELYRKEMNLEGNNLWTKAVEHLVACMEGKAENISGPSDGMAALEIALAIHESHQKQGRVVGLPLENRTLRVMSR
ncbi:MAG: Gfo/Idh/MocA family oxidoreductase [Deltaproteobacteria bacterium]|nr:Gfo/Idh/MocA family oxidoreductase [Deltaproteobacteria bacterium]